MSKKEIRKHIISIVVVSFLLIFSTAFIYLPKQENLVSALAFLQMQKGFYMEELSSGILLKDASPVLDEYGIKNDPYSFKVINDTNSDVTYKIVFKNNEEKAKARGMEVLPNRYLRYNLVSEGKELVTPSTLSDDGILYVATVKANSSQTFDFRMWLDYEADNGAMNKIFIGKVAIEEIK